MSRRNRGRQVAIALFVIFIVVPLAELYVLIQVGQVIGVWWTILLLIADSIFGSWLIKGEGGRAWRALQERINSGKVPTKELADGVLVVIGGALMLSPGFVSDVFGMLLILPFTRPVFRRLLSAYATKRVVSTVIPKTAQRPGPTESPVVQGEVIDDGS